jgi:hypothetical protein
MTSARCASEAKLSGTCATPLATIIDKNPIVNIVLALITPSLWFEVNDASVYSARPHGE